jgi:glycogen(starch) synthase
MAELLRSRGCTAVEFNICGQGSALADVHKLVRATGLDEIVRFHGQCSGPELKKMYEHAHVVVVPTTTDFRDGFNQVVAEAALAGRIVVTSRVCPAIRYVNAVVREVEPDDVQGYAGALEELYRVRTGCMNRALDKADRDRFFDVSYGWATAVERVVRSLGLRRPHRQAPYRRS